MSDERCKAILVIPQLKVFVRCQDVVRKGFQNHFFNLVTCPKYLQFMEFIELKWIHDNRIVSCPDCGEKYPCGCLKELK